MKKFGYLLMVLMLLSGLSVNAQSYGKPYRPQYTQRHSVSAYNQAPIVTMRSTSALGGSGSALPQAALTGTYTADDLTASSRANGPRRVGGGGWADEDEDPDQKDDPAPDLPEDPMPLGDAAIPLTLLALAYALYSIVTRRRKAQEQ